MRATDQAPLLRISAGLLAIVTLVGVTSANAWAWPDPPEAKEEAEAEAKAPANRLARETSPYLLKHAHNPVDWYPWGPEAFAKAKAQNKPVFLSVGYSSCYWCHVMERECFENPEIAKALNEGFVCVKVDREERPDVDAVYMAALQGFGQGGWPMSMFLTPDGRPFFGGTYFPPHDRDGMRGFGSLLKLVRETWRDHRPEIERDAERLTAFVRKSLAGAAGRNKTPLTRSLVDSGREALAGRFDPECGGFGYVPENPRRPKFPDPVNLVFLLDEHRRDAALKQSPKPGTPTPLEMVVTTLDHMARGGIRDQLAGGYHRYSTDRFWYIPHFEKMLYDNAQLASAHVLAYEATGDPRWRAEAEATFAFVARTMTGPEGGFFSALDAETKGEEGAYYVWTRDEVRGVLGEGPEAEAFSEVYGITRLPNFAKDRFVLLEHLTRAEKAVTLKTTEPELEARLATARARLLAARDRRPAPLCDDKVLTAWNGLMIAAYADGFRVFKDPRYRAAAEKSADFLLTTLRTREGRLLRTYRAGVAKLPAYLEDYAFLAHGLLRLHAATGDPKRLEQARSLTDRMIADFADATEGGFFATAGDHESLLARPKDPFDNVLPSGNSVAVRNLVALAGATGETRYLDVAGRALDAFSGSLAESPGSMPLMLVALGEYLDAGPRDAVAAALVAGDTPGVSEKAAVVTVEAGSTRVVPGDNAVKGLEVDVMLNVRPGWHVYANPSGVESALPTRVTLDPGTGWAIERVVYPAGVARALASSGAENVALYEGKVKLIVALKPEPGVKIALPFTAPALTFTVTYQACNDRVCLAPVRQKVALAGARGK